MDNRCFIIMPPGEPSGYPQGHFDLVYNYVIVPACRAAGYWPSRSGSTNFDDPIEVVKEIIDSEIVLCDLSANNSNALYGLAVRQALDLPVTLVKDLKTFILFDTNELGLAEYDESLRIDTVQKAIEILSEALKKAVESKKDRHTLLQRLSLGLPQVIAPTLVDTAIVSNPEPTDSPTQEEEPKSKEPRLPKISPLPDYVGDSFTEEEISKLKTGDYLFHLNYGKGKVNFIKNTGKDKLTSIQFELGPKLLVVAASEYFRKVKE